MGVHFKNLEILKNKDQKICFLKNMAINGEKENNISLTRTITI